MSDSTKLVLCAALAAAVAIAAQLLGVPFGGPPPAAAHTLQYSNVHTYPGHGHVDIISGTDRGDYLAGAKGNDRLYGRGGNDLLVGGGGADGLHGGDGYDQCYGGPGIDSASGCEYVSWGSSLALMGMVG